MTRHFQNGLAHLVFAFALMMFATSAQADGSWTVESQSGDVWIAGDGATPASLGSAQILPSGTKLTTGATGRVIIRRGEEAVVIAPNTSITLAPESSRGLATTIIQSIGTILLSVDKKDHQHFEVETPYLAAVVKGTKFAVTVANGRSSVHVVQGAVEVMDFKSGDVGMVRPGQTADVHAGSGLGLTVTGPGAAAPAKAQRTGRSPRAVVPATRDSNLGGVQAKTPAPVRINAAMGVQTLDVPAATGGLVRQAVAGTTASAAKNAVANASEKTIGKAVSAAVRNSASASVSAGKALGAAAGKSAGLARGASNGNSSGNGGGVALGASTGNSGGNGGGLALGASTGNSGGNGGGLALGSSNGNNGNNGNAGGNGNSAATGNGKAKGKSKG